MEPSLERGLWLKELARLAGFDTHAKLALAVHTTRQTIADWYGGGGIKKLTHQAALCSLLGISRTQLHDGPYSLPDAPRSPSGAVRV